MKLMYFTDTHIRGTNPKSRKDNFSETLKNKFTELLEIVKEEKIDFVLFGGDLFDRPDISPSVVKEFISIIQNMPKPIYSVLGNHDIYGQNPTTVNRTIIGLLDTVGVFRLINSGERIVLEKNGLSVQLTGSPFYYDIDVSEKREAYIVDKGKCDYAIHMVHGFLLDRPFVKDVPYTLIEDIADKTEADITLCGHYHSGFGIKSIHNKYFVNPGSLSRISSTLSEIERKPSCLIIEIDEKVKVRIHNLKSAPSGDEVLDRELLRKEEYKSQKLNEFIQQINSYGNFEFVNLNHIINEIVVKENIPSDIKDEAMRRISKAQEALSGGEILE